MAAGNSVDLLPDATKACLAIADVRKLDESWHRTLYAKLLADPLMQAYVSAVDKAQEMPWEEAFEALGVDWSDLTNIAGGEVAFALIPRDDGRRSIALVVNTTGKTKEVTDLLSSLAKRRAPATRSEPAVAVGKLSMYTPAAKAGAPQPRPFCYGVVGDWFIASDDLKVATGILARTAPDSKGSLAQLPAYQWVMEQSQPKAGPADIHLRFFVEPTGMAAFDDAAKPVVATPAKTKTKSKAKPKRTAIQSLQAHGFDALRAIGGVACFAVEPYDLLYHVALYAPGPHAKAMRLLDFAEGKDFVPPALLTDDMSTCTIFYHNMRQSFDAFETLFNDIIGEGEQDAFRDVIDSVRDDPDGPGVDLRKEVLDRLKQRGVVFGNYILPVDAKSERTVFAVETSDEVALADVVRRLMKGDPDVIARKVRQYTIWEVRSNSKRTDRRIPNAAICVAKGHLFVATHVELLSELLLRADGPPMSADPTYLNVQRHMEQLGAGAGALRIYSRASKDYRITYELTRMNKLYEAESIYGQMIRALVADDTQKGAKKKQQVDGALLPEYEKVMHYFAPVGIFGSMVKDGQILTGFTLRGEK